MPTGQELEIRGSRRLEFLIGNKWYNHDFVVAPFPIKKDGIISLGLLRSLDARIALAAEALEMDGQKIKFENHLAVGKRTDRQHLRVCRTEPPAENCTREKAVRSIGTVTETRWPEVKPVEEIPGEPRRTKPPTENEQTKRDERPIRDTSKIEPKRRFD
jgi:hypothetical protein